MFVCVCAPSLLKTRCGASVSPSTVVSALGLGNGRACISTLVLVGMFQGPFGAALPSRRSLPTPPHSPNACLTNNPIWCTYIAALANAAHLTLYTASLNGSNCLPGSPLSPRNPVHLILQERADGKKAVKFALAFDSVEVAQSWRDALTMNSAAAVSTFNLDVWVAAAVLCLVFPIDPNGSFASAVLLVLFSIDPIFGL